MGLLCLWLGFGFDEAIGSGLGLRFDIEVEVVWIVM